MENTQSPDTFTMKRGDTRQPIRDGVTADLPAEASSRPRADYRTLSARQLWHQGSRSEQGLILGGWLLSVLACMASGIAAVANSWSGLSLTFAGVEVYVSIYPPLMICLWWTLFFGWTWGAIPAYLATLSLALYAHMPLPWALLFACANPLGFAVLVLGYRTIAMPLHLRSANAVLYYTLMSFVASVFSSAGALIWCYTNLVDPTGLLPIWQGWWLGGFLQCLLLGGPLLLVSQPVLERWRDRHPRLWRTAAAESRRLSLQLVIAIVAGVLIYGWLTLWLGSNTVRHALRASELAILPGAVTTMLATTWTFYWVFALIAAFVGFFGYRMFTYWLDSTTRLVNELAEANSKLAHLARTDTLTGLPNRRALEEALEQQLQRTRRNGEQASLVLLDIDHFKVVNDRYGHDAGDAVIRALGKAMSETIRSADVAGRWGGEEFLVVLANVDEEGAAAFAERLRTRVESTTVAHGELHVSYTISLGVAPLSTPHREAWLKRADEALYRAKLDGRNRTAIAQARGEAEGVSLHSPC
nr:GGDEF domain-containing protein [uncultured Pseudogulbenkiania sp.]